VGRLLSNPRWPLALLLLCLAGTAPAHDFDLSVDLRAVSVSGQPSYLRGGGGKLRFDDDQEGLQLGYVRVGYRGDFTDTLRLTAEALAYGAGDVHALDLTELFLTWRPVPRSIWRSELKLGAFYPAISLENRMRGWRSPYSLSPSAINTWVGEELRTIGAEYNLDWLGQTAGGPFNLGVTAALYGWNDPAGVIVGLRGWSLHDRQTTLFNRVGQWQRGIIDGRTLFYDDIDGRVGYYAGVTGNYRGALEVRVLHYDNRGDPAIAAPVIDDYVWETIFNSIGWRWTPNDKWTVIWQRLQGYTYAGPQLPPNSWSFDAQFLLASLKHGAQRFTARYDQFAMQQSVSYFGSLNADDGDALTLAYDYQLNQRWNLAVEALRLDSKLNARRRVGAPPHAREEQLQLALRFEL
jgi:hypothetical protein